LLAHHNTVGLCETLSPQRQYQLGCCSSREAATIFSREPLGRLPRPDKRDSNRRPSEMGALAEIESLFELLSLSDLSSTPSTGDDPTVLARQRYARR
jgi:hypothetical protein